MFAYRNSCGDLSVFCIWMNDYKSVGRGTPEVFERHCEQVYMKL